MTWILDKYRANVLLWRDGFSFFVPILEKDGSNELSARFCDFSGNIAKDTILNLVSTAANILADQVFWKEAKVKLFLHTW